MFVLFKNSSPLSPFSPKDQGIMKKMIGFAQQSVEEATKKVAFCKEFLKILLIQESVEGSEKIPLAVRFVLLVVVGGGGASGDVVIVIVVIVVVGC